MKLRSKAEYNSGAANWWHSPGFWFFEPACYAICIQSICN